jgi:hypothetical protein
MNLKKRLLVWGILPMLAAVGSTLAYSIDYESNIIVATDFSSSYYVEKRFPNIEKSFNTLRKSITSRASGPDKPVLFQVIPIDELSQAKGTICDYTLHQKQLMGGGSRACDGENNCSISTKDFKTFIHDICVKSVLKRGQATSTDIEGALSLAGQLSSAQRAASTYLFIFSDMAEFRDATVLTTPPNLEGVKVIVVCGGVVNSDGFCMSQAGAWTKKLKNYGASSVDFVIESSNWQNIAQEAYQ